MKYVKHEDLNHLESIAIKLEKIPKGIISNTVVTDLEWLCDRLRKAYTYIEYMHEKEDGNKAVEPISDESNQ